MEEALDASINLAEFLGTLGDLLGTFSFLSGRLFCAGSSFVSVRKPWQDRVAELTELAYTMDKQCTDMCTSNLAVRSYLDPCFL